MGRCIFCLIASMCQSLLKFWAGVVSSAANLAPHPTPTMQEHAGIIRAKVQHCGAPNFLHNMLIVVVVFVVVVVVVVVTVVVVVKGKSAQPALHLAPLAPIPPICIVVCFPFRESAPPGPA